MRFGVWVDGDTCHDVDADDAGEAAETAAKNELSASGGDVPRSGRYDITVMAPDGTVTRHDVSIEWDPVFSARDHDHGPTEAAIAALRADRGGAA